MCEPRVLADGTTIGNDRWHYVRRAMSSGVGVEASLRTGPVLIYLLIDHWERFASQRWQKSISIGVSPLAVGLIFSGATLIAQAADFGWTAWLLVLATVMANLRLKLHPLWFIAAGAALGLAGLV